MSTKAGERINLFNTIGREEINLFENFNQRSLTVLRHALYNNTNC